MFRYAAMSCAALRLVAAGWVAVVGVAICLQVL